MIGEVDTEVSRGLRSVSLGVELHLPVGFLVVIRSADGELAGPEELGVVLRPLTESLNGPGEGVFGVIADLGPLNNSVRSQSLCYPTLTLTCTRTHCLWEGGLETLLLRCCSFCIQTQIFTLFYSISIMIIPLK